LITARHTINAPLLSPDEIGRWGTAGLFVLTVHALFGLALLARSIPPEPASDAPPVVMIELDAAAPTETTPSALSPAPAQVAAPPAPPNPTKAPAEAPVERPAEMKGPAAIEPARMPQESATDERLEVSEPRPAMVMPEAASVEPGPVSEPPEPQAEAELPVAAARLPRPRPTEVPRTSRTPESERRSRRTERKGAEPPQRRQARRAEPQPRREAQQAEVPRRRERDPGRAAPAAPDTSSPSAAPRAERQARARRQGVGAKQASISPQRWQSAVFRHLERHKRYPRAAESRRISGTVQVRFTIDAGGRILGHRITGSSGHPELDAAVSAMIGRASPLPAPPPELFRSGMSLEVPIRFTQR
jgi:protein TonB